MADGNNISTADHQDHGPANTAAQAAAHTPRDYGGNPLARALTDDGTPIFPAFGGYFQPGLYKPPAFQFANPVPLGLSGFALTTFLLSMVNLGALGLSQPNMVVGPAFAYGGFIQLLAGMWDIALGNTFGGTALSSYGGFWISIGIILTPGGFSIEDAYGSPSNGNFYAAFGLYLFGWMIFTFLLWLCTLKSTLAFNMLLLTVWLTYMCLGISYVDAQNSPDGSPNVPFTRAGGGFGIVAAFLAWYNMLAGIATPTNSFFIIPVVHFPWSDKAKADRRKAEGGENKQNV